MRELIAADLGGKPGVSFHTELTQFNKKAGDQAPA